MRIFPLSSTLLLLIIAAAPLQAQEKGQIGLTMAYPASAGLQWHATDRVAARVSASYSRSSFDTAIVFPGIVELFPTSSTTTSSTVSVGVSGVFFLRKSEAVSPYVSPRYTYVRSTADRDPNSTGLSEDGTAAHAIGGSIGVQYAPNRTFGVFGETGLEYQRHDSAVGTGISKGRTLGTRAGVGVIWYFRN